MAFNLFGGGAVQSAYVSYLALDITDNSLTLVWPSAYVNVPYTDPNTGIHYQVLAISMDVTTGNGNTNTITLPDATQVSVGQNFIITNVGLSHFTLKTSDGTDLQDVETGISYWVLLTDNTTAVGEWRVITFGAGTSQASAVALAGNGLVPLVDKLNTNVPVVLTDTVPVLDATSRAKLYVWKITGGVAIIPLPDIGSVPAGYYLSFSNLSSSQITLQPTPPGTKISGRPSLAIQNQQSLTVISDGTNWQTLGFGQNQFAISSALALDVSASGNIFLDNIQASSVIQRYYGTLSSNTVIHFPQETSYWFIHNDINPGIYTLSVKTFGSSVTSIIPQGAKEIFYSNGTDLLIAPTSLSLIDGTLPLPALSFSSNPGTGLSYASNVLAFSIGGTLISAFQKSGTIGVFAIASSGGVPIQLIADNTSARIAYNTIDSFTISTTGAVTLPVGPLTLSTGQVLIPNGSIASPAYSFSSSTGTGFYYSVSPSAIGVSVGGVLTASFSKSGTAAAISVISTGNIDLQMLADNTNASIFYNSINAINIDAAGAVTLPAAPLPITSGGTDADNQAEAIVNLMPPATDNGTLVYYEDGDWVILDPPAVGTYYLKIDSGGPGVGGTPYWSLV